MRTITVKSNYFASVILISVLIASMFTYVFVSAVGETVVTETSLVLTDGSNPMVANFNMSEYQIIDGVFHKGSTAPASPTTGQWFYDTDDFSLYIYNGTDWVSGSGGVTDHGALTGLLDDDHDQYLLNTTDHDDFAGLGDDDHTQYVLADGTRVMTGDLNLTQNELQDAVIHSSSTAPSNPVEGQLYYDTDDYVVYLWNSTDWVSQSGGGATGPAGASGTVAGLPFSYMVFVNATSTYLLNGTTGVIDWSSTDDQLVVAYAIGNLTSGRDWKETVIMKGDFVFDEAVDFGSTDYFILQLDGKVTMEGASNDNMLEGDGATYFEIIGGEWDGNKTGQTGNVAGFSFVDASSALVDNVILHGISQTGAGGGNGIRFSAGDSVTVQNCRVYDCGNTTVDNNGVGIFFSNAENNTAINNIIYDANGGIYLYSIDDATPHYTRYNTVTDNKIYNVHRDGISLYPEGDEDFLYSNVVDANIIIDASQDGAHYGIKLGDTGACYDNVLSNNIISETGTGNYMDAAIMVNNGTSFNIITGNGIHNVDNRGFHVFGHHNKIVGNLINGTRTNQGILLDDNGSPNCNENVISDNTFLLTKGTAIYIESNNNFITNNYINGTIDSGANGIYVTGGDYNHISNNYVKDVTNRGIRVTTDADYNSITNNYLEGVVSYGIGVSSADCNVTIIINNIIINNTSTTEIYDGGTGTEIHANYQDEDGWVA